MGRADANEIRTGRDTACGYLLRLSQEQAAGMHKKLLQEVRHQLVFTLAAWIPYTKPLCASNVSQFFRAHNFFSSKEFRPRISLHGPCKSIHGVQGITFHPV
jgi:hypothetical protein